MSLKAAFVKPVHWLAYVTGVSVRRARSQGCMRIMTFHGVGGSSYPDTALDDQFRFLRNNFEVLSLRELVRRARSGGAVSGRELALTFDDGLRNAFTVAYPLLQKHRIPATFFIVAGQVEEGRWLWTHESRERLRSLDPGTVRSLGTVLRGSPADGRRATFDVEETVEWMKSLRLDERLQAEAAIRDATSAFRPSARQHLAFDLMSVEDLLRLDSDLITIGSHAMTHPILTGLESEVLEHEVAHSRRLLEERLQRTVDLFCYPNGSQNEAVLACVAKYYDAAVGCIAGVVRPDSDLYLLSRISAAPSSSYLAWRLHRQNS